jgi:hypothetical protein
MIIIDLPISLQSDHSAMRGVLAQPSCIDVFDSEVVHTPVLL